MSNIDQAFINAYSDEPTIVQVVPPRPPQAPGMNDPSPKLRVFKHHSETEGRATRFEDAEPTIAIRRPPHFMAHETPTQSAEFVESPVAESVDDLKLPSLVNEHRPLSSFATPRPTPSPAFKPVFEVDEFHWPTITTDLVTQSKHLLAPVVDLLTNIAKEGRSLVGIAGAVNGVGTSTVVMCLARLIAESQHTVAVVDANFSRANLAKSLGLEFDTGWNDVLVGSIPLAESAVASLRDQMTLVPLAERREAVHERLTSIQSSVIAGMLRYHHELVLFDLGAANNPAQLGIVKDIVENCRLDAGIIVATTGGHDLATRHGIEQLSAAFGPLCLGTIGNRTN